MSAADRNPTVKDVGQIIEVRSCGTWLPARLLRMEGDNVAVAMLGATYLFPVNSSRIMIEPHKCCVCGGDCMYVCNRREARVGFGGITASVQVDTSQFDSAMDHVQKRMEKINAWDAAKLEASVVWWRATAILFAALSVAEVILLTIKLAR